jgi:hypothetical protein
MGFIIMPKLILEKEVIWVSRQTRRIAFSPELTHQRLCKIWKYYWST